MAPIESVAPIRSVASADASKPSRPDLDFQTKVEEVTGTPKRIMSVKAVPKPGGAVVSSSEMGSAEDSLQSIVDTIISDSEEHFTQYSYFIHNGEGSKTSAEKFARELYHIAARAINDDKPDYPFQFKIKPLSRDPPRKRGVEDDSTKEYNPHTGSGGQWSSI